ncbi:MAG TPA: LCP family protein [Microbacteriaceae bacterium]|nr:LCP family protein [Microbacteriaceae bacterium]
MSDEPGGERRRGRRSALHGTLARHGRLPRSGPWRSILRFVAAGVAVVVVSAFSIAAIATWDVAHTLEKNTVHLVDAKGNPVTPEVGTIAGAFNVLLVGTDTRQGQGPGYGGLRESSGSGLNDVTMLLHVSADHDHATVVSLPRDMFVPIPSCPRPGGGFYSAMSRQKINTTLRYGGLSCTVLTVQQLTGMTIPYAAEVTFDGVIAMSDAVGGVTVCTTGTINDPHTGLHLAAGEHTLKGKQALEFLRTRHGVGDGSDLGRISNQQVFLSAMLRQMMRAGTLTNLPEVYGLAKAAASNMRLTDSLNVSTLASMAMALKGVNLSKVAFIQYPNATLPDGSGVIPLPQAAATLVTALQQGKSLTITGGTGVAGVGSVAQTPSPSGTGSASGSSLTGSATGSPTTTSPGSPGTSSSTSAATDGTTGTGSPADEAVALPDTVHGQTAAEKTCSRAYDF